MERYAKAAGITASCHSLRHTFASNLLEHGAAVVALRDFLGHSQISSSERYAKISSQKIKQEYMRTMQKNPHSTGLCGEVCHRSAKASRSEDLQIEEPGCCGETAAFPFH